MINATVLDTPIGPLALLEHDGALVGGGFTADPRELHVRLHPALRAHDLTEVDDLGDITKAHIAYFDGDLTALDTIAVHQPGTPRRERLLAALRQVRPGETVTYAELAARAGLERTAARAAGQACAQNLVAPVVPCHRVLPAAGGTGLKRYGGYYYGAERKQWLLAHESGH
ncbi:MULTISPECIES: methylated-DNA--[protein]-cysteine S-methyltransferase [Thermomonospora]|uniref:Methylated-DNA-[protein]-cysteine S-methyltransferase n=1 Tax=Thermomonospora cellulosilytica TaxID=1411118 RepID=A0A7W3N5N8_9ACTN|nr:MULTISPECIES: methylated-DNA--[protein]-cysteine S-methyltransferase [Thermomonospora]MBA9008019.1 methylated-DNA-[protein]-cysteine S-methyltransferase [Thermomonospora cellulosilytica]